MARDTSGGEPSPGDTAFLVCPKGMCQAEDLEQEDYEIWRGFWKPWNAFICRRKLRNNGPPISITWAPRGNHVGPQGQSRGPPGEITWAPRGNHVGPHDSNFEMFFRINSKNYILPTFHLSHWSFRVLVLEGHKFRPLWKHIFFPV